MKFGVQSKTNKEKSTEIFPPLILIQNYSLSHKSWPVQCKKVNNLYIDTILALKRAGIVYWPSA